MPVFLGSIGRARHSVRAVNRRRRRRAEDCAPYLLRVRLVSFGEDIPQFPTAELTVEQRIAECYPSGVKTDTGDLTRRLASSFKQIAAHAEAHPE